MTQIDEPTIQPIKVKEKIMANYIEFREELETLINRYSMEGRSDTPDFILANYMTACLMAYDNALIERTKWYAPKDKE